MYEKGACDCCRITHDMSGSSLTATSGNRNPFTTTDPHFNAYLGFTGKVCNDAGGGAGLVGVARVGNRGDGREETLVENAKAVLMALHHVLSPHERQGVARAKSCMFKFVCFQTGGKRATPSICVAEPHQIAISPPNLPIYFHPPPLSLSSKHQPAAAPLTSREKRPTRRASATGDWTSATK